MARIPQGSRAVIRKLRVQPWAFYIRRDSMKFKFRNLFHKAEQKEEGIYIQPKGPYCTFKFKCPFCNTKQVIEEEYQEQKTYECPGCHHIGTIPWAAVTMRTKTHPFTFQCPYCHEVQRTHDVINREKNGYYILECDCPGCNRHIVIKTESPAHYHIEQYRKRMGLKT